MPLGLVSLILHRTVRQIGYCPGFSDGIDEGGRAVVPEVAIGVRLTETTVRRSALSIERCTRQSGYVERSNFEGIRTLVLIYINK